MKRVAYHGIYMTLNNKYEIKKIKKEKKKRFFTVQNLKTLFEVSHLISIPHSTQALIIHTEARTKDQENLHFISC
jgi:hypothetical protein